VIDENIRHIIQPELEPGEELLWAQPAKRHVLSLLFTIYATLISISGAAIVIAVFGLNVFAFIIRAETPEVALPFNFMMFMVSLCFGYIVFQMLRYSFYELIGPKSRNYALTNLRAIIFESEWPYRRLDVEKEDLRPDQYSVDSAKSTIYFFDINTHNMTFREIKKNASKVLNLMPAFQRVTDLAKVEYLILTNFFHEPTGD
jgi:hypothetical protein